MSYPFNRLAQNLGRPFIHVIVNSPSRCLSLWSKLTRWPALPVVLECCERLLQLKVQHKVCCVLRIRLAKSGIFSTPRPCPDTRFHPVHPSLQETLSLLSLKAAGVKEHNFTVTVHAACNVAY